MYNPHILMPSAENERREMSGATQWRQDIWEWRWLAAPIGAALYALRVSLEAAPSQPLWGGAIAAACFVGGLLARQTSLSLAPLNLLWAYVLWPTLFPALSLSVGFLVFDDQNVGFFFRHFFIYRTIGNDIRKFVPLPGMVCTSMLP